MNADDKTEGIYIITGIACLLWVKILECQRKEIFEDSSFFACAGFSGPLLHKESVLVGSGPTVVCCLL